MFAQKLLFTVALIAAVTDVASASAKSKPKEEAKPAAKSSAPALIKQFDDWGAYSYQSSGGKICYVLSVPKTKMPANLDHGDNFFIVSQRPGQNISYEPQVMAGYELKAGSKVDVDIDNKQFVLFTKDKAAWVENAAQEPALVAAMKSGHSLTVKATSKKGTGTTYTYSLSGITAALKQIESCR